MLPSGVPISRSQLEPMCPPRCICTVGEFFRWMSGSLRLRGTQGLHISAISCVGMGKAHMLPMLPGDALGSALEIVCYVCTAVTAVVSFVFTLRF